MIHIVAHITLSILAAFRIFLSSVCTSGIKATLKCPHSGKKKLQYLGTFIALLYHKPSSPAKIFLYRWFIITSETCPHQFVHSYSVINVLAIQPNLVGSGDITVTLWWARWSLKLPASRLFAQPFVQVHIKKTSKLRVTGICEGKHRWLVVKGTTGDRWIPIAKDQ